MKSLTLAKVVGNKVEKHYTHIIGSLDQIKKVIDIMGYDMYEIVEEDKSVESYYYKSDRLIKEEENTKEMENKIQNAENYIILAYNMWADSLRAETILEKGNISIKAIPAIDYRYGNRYKANIKYSPELYIDGKKVDVWVNIYISDNDKVLGKKFRNDYENQFSKEQVEIILDMFRSIKDRIKELQVYLPDRKYTEIKDRIMSMDKYCGLKEEEVTI